MHERNLCHLRTTAIQDWPVPESKKDVQSFLDLVNYYGRFIRNCSAIANPLTLLTKNIPFAWTENTQHAFEVLKTKITTAPVLQTFHSAYPTIVSKRRLELCNRGCTGTRPSSWKTSCSFQIQKTQFCRTKSCSIKA